LRSSNSTINFLPSSVAWCNGVFFLLSVQLTDATLDSLDCNLQTPIFLAIEQGHDFIVHALLNYGASIKTADRNRQTPLHLAARKGMVTTANDLVILLSREYTDALLRSSNSTINFLPSSVAWCNGVFFLLSVLI
jgi:ankyrin repeat protein